MANYMYPQYPMNPPGYNTFASAYPRNDGNYSPIPAQNNSIPQVNAQPGFICRQVASYDEAKAIPTDFNGAITIMTDFSHGFIYTKTLDPSTGSSMFRIYKYIPEQVLPSVSVEYAPLSVVEALKTDVDKIKALVLNTDKPQE